MANLFSIDVEDWFHLLDTPAAPPMEAWGELEPRVRPNVERLLAMLARHRTRATFFVLGWVAERSPELIRAIRAAGHEIASHGYAHELVYGQDPESFREDLLRANEAIERACGVLPRGYRAPGFSITEETPWALDVLAEVGFEYDSSLFPASRGHGGMRTAATQPGRLPSGIVEFPISTVDLGPGRVAYLGGGYLRFFPFALIQRWAAAQERAGDTLVLYLHPRDVDPDQPRLALGPRRSFMSYVGLESCLSKTERLLRRFEWSAFDEHPALEETRVLTAA